MPHVAFVPFTGLRVREAEMLALGMALPGLRQRAEAIAHLPALGLLTLAGLNPPGATPRAEASESIKLAIVALGVRPRAGSTPTRLSPG
jgi:hypothetical protein